MFHYFQKLHHEAFRSISRSPLLANCKKHRQESYFKIETRYSDLKRPLRPRFHADPIRLTDDLRGAWAELGLAHLGDDHLREADAEVFVRTDL